MGEPNLTRRRVLRGCAATIVGLNLSGCGLLGWEASYRYRLRVEGNVRGAGVYEILAAKAIGPLIAGQNAGAAVILGDAFAIDTVSQPIFVLTQSGEGGGDLIGDITQALTPEKITWTGQRSFWNSVKLLHAAKDGAVKGVLPEEHWPMMVQFDDPLNPMTLKRVQPEDVGITKIKIETADAPISTGIERRLPWLPKANKTLMGSGLQPPGVPVGDLQRLFSSRF